VFPSLEPIRARSAALARRLVSRIVGPRDLLLSFRALSSLPELLATSEEVRVLPLVGFARFAPLCRSSSDASTPGSSRSLRSDGATRRILFRPRGFAPPRRFAPHRLRGFVAPRCRPVGFVAFPGAARSPLGVRVPAFRSPRRGYSLRRVPLVSSRFCIAASFCLPVVSVRPRVSNLPGRPGGLPSEEERRGVETSHWPKPEGFLSVRKKPKLPACAGRSHRPPSTEVNGFEGVPRATTEVTVRLAGAEAPAGASGGDGRHPPRWREAHWTGNGRLRYFNRGGLDTFRRSVPWSRRTGPWVSKMLRSAEADPHIQEVVQGRGGAGPSNRS